MTCISLRGTYNGYKVVAPVMPWSEKLGYKGTRDQGLETISESAGLFGEQPVVVIGHSMGAMATLQYGVSDIAANDIPDRYICVI